MAKKLTPELTRKYKYKLFELAHKASAMPACGKLPIEDQAALLEKEYGIPTHTFRRDRYITTGSPYCIPESRMQAYARFYNVLEPELRNTAAPTFRTLAEMVYTLERRNSALPLVVDNEPLRAAA